MSDTDTCDDCFAALLIGILTGAALMGGAWLVNVTWPWL